MGEQFFTEKLLPMTFPWLSDQVYSIRSAALMNFRELTKIFGSAWAEKNILKALLDLRGNLNYLHRLTCLFGIAEISTVCQLPLIKANFVPVLKEMCKDKIPNVRMNIAKSISKIRK